MIRQKHTYAAPHLVTNIIRHHLKPTQEVRPTLPVDDDKIDIPVTITSSSRTTKPAPTANTNTSQVTESIHEVED